MNKKIIILIGIFINIILFSGCVLDESIEEMMTPPQLTIDKKEVNELLKKYLPESAEVIGSFWGKHLNLINWVDLDNDGNNEAVVFYKVESDPMPIKGIVLKSEENKWTIYSGIQGIGTEVEGVDFKDIDNNGNLEIIVGWSVDNSIDKGINIYKYNNDGVEEIFNNNYKKIVVHDLDKDGRNEVILFKINSKNSLLKAELYQYSEDKMELTCTTNIKQHVSLNKDINVIVGKVSKNKTGVFVKIPTHEGLNFTNLLILEDGKLKNIFNNAKNQIVHRNFTSYAVLPKDVDDDGIIEIPVCKLSLGNFLENPKQPMWTTIWYEWDEGQDLIFDCRTYDDYTLGCSFIFPEKWDQNVVIYTSHKDNKIEFYYVRRDTRRKYMLFTINVFDKEVWNNKFSNNNKKNYFKLMQSVNRVYVVDLRTIDEDFQAVRDKKINLEEIKRNIRHIRN